DDPRRALTVSKPPQRSASRTMHPASSTIALLRARHHQHVAQKDGTFRGDQLAGVQPIQDLPILIALEANFDASAAEAAAIRRPPPANGPTPSAHDTPDRHRR